MGVFCIFIIVAFKLHQYSQTERKFLVLNVNDFLLSNDFSDCGNGICDVLQTSKFRVQRNRYIGTTEKPYFSGVTQSDQNTVIHSIQRESTEPLNLLPTRSVDSTISQVNGAKSSMKSVTSQASTIPDTNLHNSEGFRRNQSLITEKVQEQEEVRLVLHRTVPKPTKQNQPSRIPEPHKYRGTLYFRPSQSGFGNNLYGLVSAFVISAISNRRLVGRMSEESAK